MVAWYQLYLTYFLASVLNSPVWIQDISIVVQFKVLVVFTLNAVTLHMYTIILARIWFFFFGAWIEKQQRLNMLYERGFIINLPKRNDLHTFTFTSSHHKCKTKRNFSVDFDPCFPKVLRVGFLIYFLLNTARRIEMRI